MKKSDAVRMLKAHGFVLVRKGGLHDIWQRGSESIAMPRGSVGELHGFLRQAVLKGTRGTRAVRPERIKQQGSEK